MALSLDVFNSVVFFLLKATCVLFFVGWLVEQSRDISAASARSLLAISAVVLCFVPLLTPLLPTVPIPLIPHALGHWLQMPLAERVGETVGYNAVLVTGLFIYVLVAAWLLFYTLIGIVQVAGISRRGVVPPDSVLPQLARRVAGQLQLTRLPVVKISEEVESPQVWGWPRSSVLLPSDSLQWPEGRLRRVLMHEFAHVKRRDWLVKMLLRLIAAILWFVPFVWVTVKRSAWYAELASDDWVVRLEGDRAAYAGDLLAVGRGARASDAVGFIERSSVYRRVQAVLDGTRNRAPATVADRIRHIVLMLLVLAPVASVQAVMHGSPAMDELLVQPVKLIITLPAPDQQDTNATGGAIPFKPEQLKLLRRRPADPPATEEVVTVAHLLDLEPATPRVHRFPVLSVSIDPEVAIHGPEKRVMVAPRYPRNALARGLEGRVMVRFDVDVQGNVVNPVIVNSEPSGIFDQAVLHAVSQFKYRPQKVNEQSVITKSITETFVFQVSNGTAGNQTQPDKQLPTMQP